MNPVLGGKLTPVDIGVDVMHGMIATIKENPALDGVEIIQRTAHFGSRIGAFVEKQVCVNDEIITEDPRENHEMGNFPPVKPHYEAQKQEQTDLFDFLDSA